tara:strand:+ start:2797 stop:3702 length:906 start_codon:yes stop_codon:yes gene_type:complete
MNKKIIVKISEGLGNQLFMYANAYAISKKFDLHLNLDPYSGYYRNNVRSFMLDNLNISSDIAPPEWVFADNYRNLIKHIKIKLDYFRNKRSFLFEFRNKDKSTFYNPINLKNTNNIIYIDGNFESEKYFLNYRKELLDEFSFKNKEKYMHNKFLDMINTENVVSISIRQNRFSERIKNKNNTVSIRKSEKFVIETVDYIYKSIEFIKTKIQNPKFLIWSNDFNDLQKYFPKNEFFYVQNYENKILNDFYLLTQCKNFIVGPSTFSWWGAWLSDKNDKICIRPKYLNPSNNKDFWPEDWISI